MPSSLPMHMITPMHLLHRLDAHFELALIEHRNLRSWLDAPWLGVAGGVDQPCDARRNEMLIPVGLEHVERFFIGERGVINVLDAVTDALLDRARGTGMSRQHFVPA